MGIRELKDNLSQYVRRVEAGERLAVTANGRVVAELSPPSAAAAGRSTNRLQALLASGVVVPASEQGDPTEGWAAMKLPRLRRGTVASLIDADRDDA